MMTGRECVQTTLAHRSSGRVPVDFGATLVTGLHVSCVAALREHFGLEQRPVKVRDPGQMLGIVDDDLRAAMGVDVVGVFPRKTRYGFVNENWREVRTPWGQGILAPEQFRPSTASNGDWFIHPQGDHALPPSAHMPRASFFFDNIIRQDPIDEEHLNPADNLEEFVVVTDADLEHFRCDVAHAQTTGAAIVAAFGGMSLGDIGNVPAPALVHPKGIRGVAEWYMATIEHPDYVHEVFTQQYDIALQNLTRIHAMIGDAIDVVYVCSTDFGTQQSQFCSVQTFRELYLPHYQRLNGWIHRHTRWKTFKHTCGAVDPLIPALIDAGFDVLNPVQCSATGMDPDHLKASYGAAITFWGGGVDTQKALPFGRPAEVREQVLRRCEIFARNGGFVFNSIHNVQACTPVRNIVAMLDAVHEFNGCGGPA